MKNYTLIVFLLILITTTGLKAQEVAIRTNLLYWGTTTPNLSVETALGKKTTLEITGGYNPFSFSDNKKLRHWLVQPELRLWTCEKFLGSFFGFHAHYGYYNVGGIKLPLEIFEGLQKHRYQGYAAGGGFSYGHQWYLGSHWNIEAQFGFGYTYTGFDKYECHKCGEHLGKGHKHYFGPTRIGVSLVYLFKSKK
ncbi:MAG: DUF3575 domain-containing protein [Tannerellaceae bacterium]|nr:DUF3575 domain-containing protein [Tannerellaceae bacterium]